MANVASDVAPPVSANIAYSPVNGSPGWGSLPECQVMLEITPASEFNPPKTTVIVYGWRFVHEGGTSDYQSTPQEVGTLYTVPDPAKPIEVSRYGFHVSSDPVFAIRSGADFWVERAKLSGKLDPGPECVAASERTPMWREDARRVLAGFAADCAARAAKYISERGITPTKQTARYIRLARRWAEGKISDVDMHDETDGYAWTPNAPLGAVEAEQAAIWAARIFSGYECVHCALFDAAEAISYAASQDPKETYTGEGAFVGEQLWQAYELHDRLMRLAPKGYVEAGIPVLEAER